MRKTKRLKVSLALVAILVGCCAIWLITPSLAHIENTVSWQSTINPSGEITVNSDLLTADGQTVVLNELSSGQRTVSINISSAGGAVSGRFTCEPNNYLTASFDQPQVNLLSGDQRTVNLTLTATEACNELAEAQTETVHVMWTPDDTQIETLWADILVPVTPEPEDTVQNGVDQAAVEQGDNTEEDAENTTADPEVLSQTQIQQSAASDEEGNAIPVQTANDLIVNWTPSFSDKTPLGLVIYPQAGCKSVILECNGEDFPRLSRYIINGKSTVLYDGGKISLPTDADVVVLIDFSNIDFINEQMTESCIVSACAYFDEQLRIQQVQVKQVEQGPFSEPEHTLVLTEDTTLDLPVQVEWPGCTYELTFYRLEAGETGTVEWRPLETEQSGIQVQPGSGSHLLLSLDETFPPAGTYQMELTWKLGDTTVLHKKIVFFIQYNQCVKVSENMAQ